MYSNNTIDSYLTMLDESVRSSIDKNLVNSAYNYMKEKHNNQKNPMRMNGIYPYWTHPANVLLSFHQFYFHYKWYDFFSEKDYKDVEIAILLHDIVEDTDGTLEEIKSFSPRAAEIVNVLSKNTIPNAELLSKEERLALYWSRINTSDIYVKLIKVLDRLDNISDIPVLLLKDASRYRSFAEKQMDETDAYVLGLNLDVLPSGGAVMKELESALNLVESMLLFDQLNT